MALSHSSAERASSFFRRASRLYSLLAVSGPGTPACIASLFQTPLQAREIAHNRKHHKHPCSCQQCPVKHAPVPDEKKGAQPYQGRHQQDIVLQGIRPVPVQKGMESPGGTAAITKPPRGFVKRALPGASWSGRGLLYRRARRTPERGEPHTRQTVSCMEKACGMSLFRKP